MGSLLVPLQDAWGLSTCALAPAVRLDATSDFLGGAGLELGVHFDHPFRK